MTIIPELASQIGRKDDQPNQVLGKKLVANQDLEGIKEAAENLTHPDRKIQVDCLGVLEQVGRLAPELIEDYLDDFLVLAFGSDNRLVWQSLINLALIADRKPDRMMACFDQFVNLIKTGSVIMRDNCIKILARAGAAKPEYIEEVYPILIDQLKNCRAKSLPQYTESILPIISTANLAEIEGVLLKRLPELSQNQERRISRVVSKFRNPKDMAATI